MEGSSSPLTVPTASGSSTLPQVHSTITTSRRRLTPTSSFGARRRRATDSWSSHRTPMPTVSAYSTRRTQPSPSTTSAPPSAAAHYLLVRRRRATGWWSSLRTPRAAWGYSTRSPTPSPSSRPAPRVATPSKEQPPRGMAWWSLLRATRTPWATSIRMRRPSHNTWSQRTRHFTEPPPRAMGISSSLLRPRRAWVGAPTSRCRSRSRGRGRRRRTCAPSSAISAWGCRPPAAGPCVKTWASGRAPDCSGAATTHRVCLRW